MAIVTMCPRARFAADPSHSRGRLYNEPSSPSRNEFRRDCDRIIHSAAFRRLKHKTQVFVWHEGDHYRTRLTHTLEVQQIARSIARAMGLDEDLAECLALAHDLGHTPFGHAGERALDAAMADFGGFDHNAQSLRLVTRLESRYAAFDGLNLTWETLEGLVKHNGPLIDRSGAPLKLDGHGLPHAIKAHATLQDLELWSWPGAEAQVAAIADDIAYDAHDIDDGLRAGLFSVDELEAVPFVGDMLREVRSHYPGLEAARTQHEIQRRVITRMIGDVIAETGRRVDRLQPRSYEDVRRAGEALVGFSSEMAAVDAAIKGFLYPRMYRHATVMRVMHEAERVVRDLFAHYFAHPQTLPVEWARGLDLADEIRRARRIADYVAGMTDRYALLEHRRLFAFTPDLM